MTRPLPVLALVFLIGPVRAEDPNSDQLTKDSVWIGEFRVLGESGTWKMAMTVTDRKDAQIEATILAKTPEGPKTGKFKGKATTRASGSILLEPEEEGFTQGLMSGSLKNGKLTFAFAGRGKLGKKFAGTAVLEKKK